MSPSPPTVLIVEDEVQLADLFEEWLRAEYDVRVAYSGEDAIEELDDDLDVVLLDRRMPGMSGDEVLDEIESRGIDCSIAMITAVDPDFDIIEMGFDDYLIKPIKREELIELIEGLLTLPNYEDVVQEYYQLASKKATLEMNKTEEELAESDEYNRLLDRFTIVKNEADEIIQGFDETDDIVGLF